MLVFLIPALADDQSEPNASPPEEGLAAAGDLTDEATEVDFGWGFGAWTDVK